jgi:8-oxo-dGTP pyrophosphatase MutT (NUDIX family)
MCEVTSIGPALELRESATARRVPDPSTLERIDEIWALEIKSRGSLFNGNVFTYLTRQGDTILGRLVEYKCYVAQKRDPSLRQLLGIQPVAVSGLSVTGEGILVGRRSKDVTDYPDFFELVPSGSISGDFRLPSGSIDYQREILRELDEETGISADRVASLWPFALVFNPADGVHDVVIEIKLHTPSQPVFPAGRSDEYRHVEPIKPASLGTFLSANAARIVPTSLAVLKARFDASPRD